MEEPFTALARLGKHQIIRIYAAEISKMKKAYIIILLALLMLAGMWVSSGNMTPYSAILENPYFIDYKGNLLDSAGYASKVETGQKMYLVNYDHLLYKATYHMLNNEPRELWWFNVVQRRILYYLIAFPFMKWLGFASGGFVATMLITLLAVLYAYRFVKKKYGDRSALFFMLLMSTYPGIMYWCGTSFAQVLVVPLCLIFYIRMLVYEEAPTPKNAGWLTLVFAIGFLGYDLAAYFVPAVFLLFISKRQWKHLPLVVLMMLPSVALNIFYVKVMGFPLLNDNTSIYTNMLLSYANMDWAIFSEKIKHVPHVLYRNYVDSQFLFLGILGVVLLGISLVFTRKTISKSGVLLSGCMLFIFLFSNMAPPYGGDWHLEGYWIARIYQPLFVVIIFAMVSLIKELEKFSGVQKVILAASFIVFLLNTYVVFGPITGHFELVSMYEKFYETTPPGTMEANIEKYGAKPIGF